MLGALQTLLTALKTADQDGVHPEQRDHACGRLANAAKLIAQLEVLEGDVLEAVRVTLLFCSQSPDPEPDASTDKHFDEHPSWGTPCARIEAAQGLMRLTRKPTHTTPALLAEIERLAHDPVRAVRYQIISSLSALFYSAPDLMWRLATHLAENEESCGVLRSFLGQPISILARSDMDRVVTIAIRILGRIHEGAGTEDTRARCFRLLAQLFLWKDHSVSREALFILADKPTDDARSARHVLLETRNLITHGPVSPADATGDGVRKRALALFERILVGAFAAAKKMDADHQGTPFEQWGKDEKELYRDLARLVDSCGDELYFGSGAYALGRNTGGVREGEKIPPAAMLRFYQEGAHLIDQLADSGLASVTHHLLETLQEFISFDPRGVFLRIGRVVLAGAKGGYQFETLGANLLVSIVERYLAEYPVLFREDADCRVALMNSLDLFVRAGWPSARSLTYRLDDIYR